MLCHTVWVIVTIVIDKDTHTNTLHEQNEQCITNNTFAHGLVCDWVNNEALVKDEREEDEKAIQGPQNGNGFYPHVPQNYKAVFNDKKGWLEEELPHKIQEWARGRTEAVSENVLVYMHK